MKHQGSGMFNDLQPGTLTNSTYTHEKLKYRNSQFSSAK